MNSKSNLKTLKIAFVGKMCSGKTTASKYIINKFSGMIKLSFADKIRDIAHELFNMEKKDRKLLQDIGTAMRSIDPDVFTNYLIRQSKQYEFVCIDDGRFLNEIKTLKKNGFYIIKLNISKNLQLKRLKYTYPNTYKTHLTRLNHHSELEMDSIKVSIFNSVIDVDKEDLFERLDNLF